MERPESHEIEAGKSEEEKAAILSKKCGNPRKTTEKSSLTSEHTSTVNFTFLFIDFKQLEIGENSDCLSYVFMLFIHEKNLGSQERRQKYQI